MFVEKMPIHHRIAQKSTIKSSYAQAYREFDGFGVIEIKINIPPTICLNDGHRECVMTAWKINYIWIVLRYIWSIYTIVIFMYLRYRDFHVVCVIFKFLSDVPSINLGKKPFFLFLYDKSKCWIFDSLSKIRYKIIRVSRIPYAMRSLSLSFKASYVGSKCG